jgi:hypothetical protein
MRRGYDVSAPSEEKLHAEWPDWYVALMKRYAPRPVFNAWIASEKLERPNYTNAVAIAFRAGIPISTEHPH